MHAKILQNKYKELLNKNYKDDHSLHYTKYTFIKTKTNTLDTGVPVIYKYIMPSFFI